MPRQSPVDHAFRRWRSGFSANVYGRLVTALIQIVGVPVLLHFWGPRLYGEWLILTAIPTYLSVTDLGFSQSAANDMTQRVARGDYSGALAVFHSLGTMVFTVVALALLLVSGLLIFLPIQRWVGSAAVPTPEVRWILALLSAEILVRLGDGVSHAGYRATGDYPLHVSINFSTLLLQAAVVWLVASIGGGLLTAAVMILVVRLLATPIAALVLLHRHSWLSFRFKWRERQELTRLFHPAVANVSLPLAQALSVQGLIIVIGATLGSLAVVIFSTLRTLTRLAVQAVITASGAAEPEFATAIGLGDYALLQKLYIHTLRVGFWLAILAIGFLGLAGGPILSLWTRGRVPMNLALFNWLLLSAFLSVLWYSPLTLLKAANRHLRAVLLYLAVAATTVAGAGLLVHFARHLALAGAALLLTDVAMIGYCFPASANLSHLPAFQALREAVNPFPLLTSLRTPRLTP